jgi:queuine tRNA-ribosyltransferase
MPTRNGRNGMLFTTSGIINIRNEKWKNDLSPLDTGLENRISQGYSRAYLRHLIVSKEMLGAQIASKHNVFFYMWLVKEARKHIMSGEYLRWKSETAPLVAQRL